MSWLEVGIDETQAFERKFFKILKQNSIVNSVFEFYRRLHLEKNFGEKFYKVQKVKIAVEELTWCIQIIALLWTPNMPIKNWNNNNLLWNIIDFLRIDTTCSSFGIMGECLYLSILITFINFSGILVLVFAIYRSINIPHTIFKIFRKLLYLWVTQLSIPSMILFSIFLKYNFSPQKEVAEYKGHNKFSDFEINTTWEALTIIAMIVAFILLLFFAEYSGEIRHSASWKNLGSRAHSKIEVHKAIFTYSFPILYTILAEDHIAYFQLYTMITSGLFTIETIIFNPYYWLYYHILVIIRFSVVSLVSFLFLLGYWLNNSLLITLLTVILVPLYSILIVIFVLKSSKKKSKIIPGNLVGISSKYSLEKLLRYALCSNDFGQKNKIIYIFEKYFLERTLDRDKLQVIWAANYCLFVLKDESLAKVKLSKTKSISDYNLEANYQEYLCNKKIQNFAPSESTNFLNYFQRLKKIKKEDSKLCTNLLKFWKEVTASKPSLRILIKYLNFISYSVEFLNKEYPQLMKEFSNSRESISFYSSYVGGILYDYEKSVSLDGKFKNFNRDMQNSQNNSKNLDYFSENNGILIISAEEKNFGEIFYANSKSAEILKTPLKFLIGSTMSSFTPGCYKDIFRNEIKWSIHFQSNSERNFNDGFFVTLPTGFLLECIGKSSLVSINDCIANILVFKPKDPKYQSALISEAGEICCHSEYFSKFSKFTKSNLIGYSLKKLYSGLEESNLKPLTPYRLRNFENETILVLSHFFFNKIKIPYVLLTDDPEEIKKWKDGAFELPNDSEEEKVEEDSQNLSNSSLSLSLNTEDNSPKSSREIEHEYNDSKANLKPINLNETSEVDETSKNEERPGERSPASHSSQKSFLDMMITSSRSINILHTVYVISVIFMQILVVIASNIAVLIFAYINIDFVSNISFPITVGKIGNYFQISGFMGRVLYFGSSGSIDIENTMYPALINHIRDLEKMYRDSVNHLESWDYCSSKSIFTNDRINFYDAESKIYKKKNLLDTIALFIKNGNELISKYNNSEDYFTEVSFLMQNGYGDAFNYCNSSLYDIIECQKSKIDDFQAEMIFLLGLGILVLAVCVAIIAPFCYSTIRIENNFWNKIRKNASEHFFDLTQSCLERLVRVHNQPEVELNSKSPSKRTFNFKNYWKYAWRVLLYFIAILAFSLINILYLYQQCVDYLSYRPEIIRELIQSRILYTGLGVWTSEVALNNFNNSDEDRIKYSLPFKNSKILMEETINKIKHTELQLRKSKYSSVLSEKIKKTLYENADSTIYKEVAFGIYSGGEISIFDDSFVSSESYDVQLWLHSMMLVNELNINYDELITEADHYSQSIINRQITIIVAVLVFFIMISFLMYFGLYLRFFNEEKKSLSKMNTIMEIIP